MIYLAFGVALCVLAALAYDAHRSPMDDGRPHFRIGRARVKLLGRKIG